jgi:pimeloyl-ACP methyl ester carboxylesterase
MFNINAPAGVSRRAVLATSAASLVAGALAGRARAAEGINVRSRGAGRPTILFVHGFGCALDDWDAQLGALSADFTCVALDLPGHGGSARPAQPGIEALAAAVNRVKAERGDGDVLLVGHSMGVKVVREAYRQSPERVRGMVFVDSSVYVGDQETLIRRQRDQIRAAGFQTYVGGLFGAMFVDNSNPRLKARMVERSHGMDPALGEALLVDSIRWELSVGGEALRNIRVPVLAIQSTAYDSNFKRVSLQDGVRTPFMDVLERDVPNSEVKVVLGVGHFPMIEAADTVNGAIRDFARRAVA